MEKDFDLEQEEKLKYYMSLPYEMSITRSPEGGYVGSIPDLPGCITQGETRLEVLEMLEDAKLCWLEAALDLGQTIYEPDWDLYNGKLNVRIPKTLHKELAAKAKREGVKLNQLIIYLISKGIDEQLEDKQV